MRILKMNFIYTNHAQENLIERKISKQQVEQTILNPETIIKSKKGRNIAHRIFGSRLLRVIYIQTKKAYIVITTYYTNPQRYET